LCCSEACYGGSTTKAPGNNFGLVICKRTMETHRGKIAVESTFGKGTTFIIIMTVEQKVEITLQLEYVA
jgi:signal transduction histidine kinase